MTTEIQEKIARLPIWVREHIRLLELRPQSLADEVVTLRRKQSELEKMVRFQKDRIEAMIAMFQCAAKGENEVAVAVTKIVEDYIIDDAE